MKTILLLLINLPVAFVGNTETPPGQTPPKRLVAGLGHKPLWQLPPKLLSQQPTWLSTGQANVPVRDVIVLLNQLPAGKLINSGSLLSATGTEPRYVAIGGSLTAGYRNGGLYREAQSTSYPNLIARQIGLVDFRQPLFDLAEGNGSGYKQLISGGLFPQYNDVTNNRAIVSNEPLTLTTFTERADNLGMPFLGVHSSYATEEWRLNDKIGPGVPYEPAFRSYFRRLLPKDNQQWLTNYVHYALEQKADLMTIELGMDDAIWFASAGGYRLNGVMTQLAMGEGSPIIALLTAMKTNRINGAIATVPDVLAFPYFKFYTTKAVRKSNGDRKLYAVVDDRYDLVENGTQFVSEVADSDILLPSDDVNALATGRNAPKGLSPDSPLSSHDVLSAQEINALRHVVELNSLIKFQAAKATIPVVDLQDVYSRILSGQYVTDDGLVIDPSFPARNFFSADGLHPSAIGQAVIANEWIRVLNNHYQTKIPFIPMKQFMQLLAE